SLQGAMKQAKTIESLERRLGASAPFWLLPTLPEINSVLAEDLLQELRRRFCDQVIPTAIRRDIKLKEAVSFGQPVIEYEPESTGARDYTDLADWLTRQWQPAERPEAPRHLTPTTGDAFHDHTATDTEIDRSTIRVLTNFGSTSELAHRIAAVGPNRLSRNRPPNGAHAFALPPDPRPC
ncbi:MAG: cellulose synthase operon protein YhjQ/BcsQ, partial [Pseudomonadota bacterium]